MKYLFLILTSFLWVNGIAQNEFSSQYRLIRENIRYPDETLLRHTQISSELSKFSDTFFIDYIVKKYADQPQLNRFISNKYFLEKFQPEIMNENEVILKSTNEAIAVGVIKRIVPKSFLKNVIYDSLVLNGMPEFNYVYIDSIDKKKPYGIAFDTIEISNISSITVTVNGREYPIADSLYNDLYFPNFCAVEYGLKPIECFYSPDKKFAYIYLFGGQPAAPFCCKIIFDIENHKAIGRMIANEFELVAYKCLRKNFIGF